MTKIWQKGDARFPRLGHRPPSISSSGLTPRGEGNWDLRPIATKWANNSLLGPGSLVNPSDCSTTFIFKILILIWERKSVSVCVHGGGQRISLGARSPFHWGFWGLIPWSHLTSQAAPPNTSVWPMTYAVKLLPNATSPETLRNVYFKQLVLIEQQLISTS